MFMMIPDENKCILIDFYFLMQRNFLGYGGYVEN